MQDLTNAMAEMMEDEVLQLTDKYLAEGRSPQAVLDAYQAGMAEIGRRYEAGEYFVSELILAGEMMNAGSEKIKPFLKGDDGQAGPTKGKVLVATVEGDIHDIGKNIAVTIMELAGYEVRNMGEDVPVAKIVEEVKNWNPMMVGLSGLLTLAYDPMKAVVDGLKEAGVRDQVNRLRGGGRIDDHVLKCVGADAYANDAMTNVTYLNSLG